MERRCENPVKYRVLATEPSPVERRLLAAALDTIGCECTFAATGAEALECLPGTAFDLIILVNEMPDMPAGRAVNAVRRVPGWKGQIPICVIYPDSGGPAHAKAAGTDACFHKPLPISQFLVEVRGHAEAGRQLRLRSLTGWSVLEQPISGVEDLRSPAAGANFDATRLRRGLETGRLTHAMLGKGVFSFGAIRTGSALRLRGELPANSAYFASGLGSGGADSFWGNDLLFGDTGGIIATGCGHEFDSVHSQGVIQYAALAVPETLLSEVAQTIAPKFCEIRRPIAYQPQREHRLKMTRSLHKAIRALKHARASASTNFDPDALILNVLTTFLTAMEEDRGPAPPLPAARKIIAQVEEMARLNELDVSVPWICLKLGQPLHCVETAFRHEFDTSPGHYLRMFQLCRAREELARGEDSLASVAARNGFHQLGQFAGRYRRVFGEAPSQTLAIGKGGKALRGAPRFGDQTVDLLRNAVR